MIIQTVFKAFLNNVINFDKLNQTLLQNNIDNKCDSDEYVTRIEESSRRQDLVNHEIHINLNRENDQRNRISNCKDYKCIDNDESNILILQLASISNSYKEITDNSLFRQHIINQKINSINDELQILNSNYLPNFETLDILELNFNANYEIEELHIFSVSQFYFDINDTLIFKLQTDYGNSDFLIKVFHIMPFQWVKHRYSHKSEEVLS